MAYLCHYPLHGRIYVSRGTYNTIMRPWYCTYPATLSLLVQFDTSGGMQLVMPQG